MREGAFRALDPQLAARAFLGMVFDYLTARVVFGQQAAAGRAHRDGGGRLRVDLPRRRPRRRRRRCQRLAVSSRARVRSGRRSLAAALALAAGIAVGLYWCWGGGWISTDDAFVEGTMSFLAAEIPGRVHEVAVDQHQAVHAGDLLVRLDPSDYEARVARARADLADGAQPHARRRGRGGVGRGRAPRQRGRALAHRARAGTGLDAVRGQRREPPAPRAGERRARLGGGAHARPRAARRGRGRDARRRRARCTRPRRRCARPSSPSPTPRCAPPSTASSAARTSSPGTIVSPGQPLLALAGAGRSWVIANFKETQIGDIARRRAPPRSRSTPSPASCGAATSTPSRRPPAPSTR